jgi:CRP-like cAMP-binding protein
MKKSPLQELFLWEGLEDKERLDCIKDLPTPKTFEKGEVIYSEKEFPRAFAVVLSGKVSVCAHNGAAMRILEQGDCFGVTALFGNERYATTITIVSRAKLQFISEELLTRWMAQHPQVSMNYIRLLHQKILYLNQKIRLYTESSVEERLMDYISAHTAPNGEIRFAGGLAAVARELNIGRTSLYRTLDQLVEKGIVIKKENQWFKEEK